MSFDFQNKVVLITGGGTGIGRATAQAFANAGAKVLITDNNEKEGMETLRLIGGESSGMFLKADVTRLDEMEAAVAAVIAAYGRLDIAFNNAGVEAPEAPTAEIQPKDWDRLLSIDLTGVFNSMRAELTVMVTQGSGIIVNTSSIAAAKGLPNIAAYSAAKHGVVGLTKSAAVEYARSGIRINAVLPGPVDTPLVRRVHEDNPGFEDMIKQIVPLGRTGQPEEIADAVLFLSSDRAAYIIGHSLVVDGGMTA